ncbi:MAG TPA: ABC transporter substrate-binding protein [Chloroflexota bacterium]|nr:ABC transporter substrate-binding protein [Chloroflexota bacterium]
MLTRSFARTVAVSLTVLALAACGPAAAPPAPAPTPPAAAQPPAAAPTTAAAPVATAQPAAGQPTAAKPSGKDTLTIVFQANQGTLDPHFAATNQEMLIIRNVYNALLKYKPDSVELTGDLATSWDVSPDGLTYTFKLRQDVDWQKGFGHFTANDVKASFDRVKNPETKSPFAGSISMLKETQVVDDYTVKMILSEPYAAFPHLLTNYRAGPIVNMKAVQQFGKDYDWNPIGTGAYQFESGVPKQEAIIVASESYKGTPAAIKRVVTRTVPDVNAQVVGLENGQYDMLYLAPDDPVVVKRLEDKGFVRSLYSRNLPSQLLMNVTVKPFDDLRVRQAIAYSIDRQQYVDLVYPGIGKPWYSPVPEGYSYVATDLPRYDKDVNKAKSLLAEAGYPSGLDLTMNVYDVQKTASDVIAEQLKQAGIRVKEEVLDQPTFIAAVVQDKGINFAVHCCVRQPDPDIILSDMFSPKGRGAIYISHADLETDLAAARKELDTKKREQLYAELQKKIIQDVLQIPLAMIPDRSMHVSSLKGMPKLEALWGLDLSRLTN